MKNCYQSRLAVGGFREQVFLEVGWLAGSNKRDVFHGLISKFGDLHDLAFQHVDSSLREESVALKIEMMQYLSWVVWVEGVDVVKLSILVLPVLNAGVTSSDDVQHAESFVPSGEQHTSKQFIDEVYDPLSILTFSTGTSGLLMCQ
jgi:hypothetical protein